MMELIAEIFIRSWFFSVILPDFGMGVCGCSVADRKCRIGKSAMIWKISIT